MSEENNEMRRILQMVEDGTISPDDADRLIDELHGQDTICCPWCAETIPSTETICPECGSDPYHGPNMQPLHNITETSLGTLNGVLICYCAVVGLIVGLSCLRNIAHLASICQFSLAVLALFAAYMMFKRNPVGWTLGMVWSGLQIIEVIINRTAINRQFLHVGANFLTNGTGLGINIIGIVLLVLFIKARPCSDNYNHQIGVR